MRLHESVVTGLFQMNTCAAIIALIFKDNELNFIIQIGHLRKKQISTALSYCKYWGILDKL